MLLWGLGPPPPPPGSVGPLVNSGLGFKGSPCPKTLGCLHSWMWVWVSRLMGMRPLYALLSNVICGRVQSEPWGPRRPAPYAGRSVWPQLFLHPTLPLTKGP